MLTRFCARVVAAAGLVAAAYVGLPAAPAAAATCSTADGVSVVVDFHELGGGAQSACLADGGGRYASDLFTAAGFPLTYVQSDPGFVCRVSGKPADDPCTAPPPADAYWALWWSDGKSGEWKYATSGARSFRVPEGAYVAFSWTGSSSTSKPGTSPTPHAAQPSPSSAPSPSRGGGTGGGSGAGGGGSTAGQPTASPGRTGGDPQAGSAGPSAKASASGSAKPKGKGDRKPGASATASPSASAESPSATVDDTTAASSDPADPGDGGLPSWVAPLAIAGLFVAAGAVALVRRRRATPGP